MVFQMGTVGTGISEDQGIGLTEAIRSSIRRQEELQAVVNGDDLPEDFDEIDADDDQSSSNSDEAAEPPELEDLGDSDCWLLDDIHHDPFDAKRSSSGRKIPPVLRYRAQFAIDNQFVIWPLDGAEGAHFAARQRMARAVARHLQENNLSPSVAGDWVQIPAIDGHDNLLRLAAFGDDKIHLEAIRILKESCRKGVITKKQLEAEVQNRLRNCTPDFAEFYWMLKRHGQLLKSMILRLPSGDVVTAEALLSVASNGKRAARAGALRMATNRPCFLAGEKWTESEWTKFNKVQTDAANKARNTASQITK